MHLEKKLKTFRIYDISFAANEMHRKLVEVHAFRKEIKDLSYLRHMHFAFAANEMLRITWWIINDPCNSIHAQIYVVTMFVVKNIIRSSHAIVVNLEKEWHA